MPLEKEYPDDIDIIKFICVFFMIVNHAVILLIPQSGPLDDTNIYFVFFSRMIFISYFSLSLPAVAGISMGRFFKPFFAENRSRRIPIRLVAALGIFLTILGFMMSGLAWGWDRFFTWNVLQLIALSFILCALILKYTHWSVLILLGIVSLFAGDPIREILPKWDLSYFQIIFFGDYSQQHYWPFFPWFATIVFGMWAGVYFRENPGKRQALAAAGIISGLLLLAISLNQLILKVDPLQIQGPTVFQPPPGTVCAVMAFFTLLIFVGKYASRKIKVRPYGLVMSYSKGILWVYLVHLIIGYYLFQFIKRYDFTLFSVGAFITILLLSSWLTGAAAVFLFHRKKVRVVLKKTDTC